MYKRLISIVCALMLLATPAYAAQLFTSTYKFDQAGPLTRHSSDNFNTIHESLDTRIHTLESGSAGGAAFRTFTVAGQDDVVAEIVGDTIDFEAGTNITITTDASFDIITISASASSSVGSLPDLDDVSGIAYTDGDVLRADGAGYVEATLAHSDLTLDDGINPHSLTLAGLGAVALAGDTMTGLLVLSGEPTIDLHAATKLYVDTVAAGLSVRESCRITTSADVTIASELENGDTLNGVVLATNDRVLLKDQADASENGIYVAVASGAASRSTDYDTDVEVTSGTFTFVWDTTATLFGGTGWVLVTPDPITVDTTDLTFSQTSTIGNFTAGDGLDLVATEFSTDLATNGGLEIASTELKIDLDGTSLALGAGGISVDDISGFDLNDLGDTNLAAPADGQQVTWNDGTSKWVAASASGGTAGGNVVTTVTFIVDSRATSTRVQWNNLPSSAQELFNSDKERKHMDLSGAMEYRVLANMYVAGASGTDLNVHYSTDNITFVVADAGGGEGELDISTGTGLLVGSWADLVVGAKTTNSYFGIVGKDGNGATDPRFSWLAVQFRFPAGIMTDEQAQDAVLPAVAGGTQTLITVTEQDATNDMDFVVENDLTAYDWTSVGPTELSAARIEDAYIRNNADDVTSGNITLFDTVSNSPALILKDGTLNIVSWVKLDAGGSIITDTTGALFIRPSGDTDDYFTFTTAADIPTIGTIGSSNLAITADGGSISFDNEHLTTSGTLAAGATTITGIINTTVGLDGVGAIDLDYGSGDITDHSFLTDDSSFIIDGGITVSTGDTITLGAVQWDDGSDRFDAAAWGGGVAGAYVFNLGGSTSLEIPNAADVTANITAGMISWDSDDDILYVGDGINLVAMGGGAETVGELQVNYTVPATANSVFSAADAQLDVSSMAATSEVHGWNVAAVGTTSGSITGLGVHTGVDPIHQHTGTFLTPDQATPDAYAGEIPSGGSWSDGLDGETLFEATNDEIYIGDAAKFGELEVILSTPCSKNEALVFEYQNTDTSWDVFVPVDGTIGFQQDGVIEWTGSNLVDWKSDSDPGGGDTAPGYYVRARRERTGSATDPIATTIKLLDPVEYHWNASGDLGINNIVSNSYDGDGAVDQDYGSADILDHTFTTDGGEVIIDGTIVSDSDDILMVPAEYATITLAEAAATAGDTILIQPGTYNEVVTLDVDDVTIQGYGWQTIINGGTTGDALQVTSDRCTIRDLAVQTTAAGGNEFRALHIANNSDMLIERVRVVNSDDDGMRLSNTTRAVIRDCVVEDADGQGIVLAGAGTTYCLVTGTRVVGAVGQWGLLIESDFNVASSCHVEEGASGSITLHADSNESVVDGCWTSDGTIVNEGTDNVVGDNVGGKPPPTPVSVVLDPGSWYDENATVFMFELGDEAPNGITIDAWKCSCNVDPDVEIDANLKRADAWIGLASAADMDAIDTTNGASSEATPANINGGAVVANGQVIYLEFDADPEGTCTQMIFQMWYYEE